MPASPGRRVAPFRTRRRVCLSLFGLAIAGAARATPGRTSITFRFNDADATELRAVLDRFERANPDIAVTLQRVAWKDARDQLLREAAVGRGPDVVHIAFVWTRELARAGVLRAIDDLNVNQVLPIGDFVAADLVREAGRTYGVPWTADTWAMVYRTDLLEQAGVPHLPSSWDELLAASAQVKQKTGKYGFVFPGGSGSSGGMWFLANYYWWSHGVELVSGHADGSFSIGLDRAAIASAMQYFKTFLAAGHAPAAVVSYNDAHDPAIMNGLAQGHQAIGIMPVNTYKQLLKMCADANPGRRVPLTSGLVPAGTRPGLTHVGGRTLAINANTKQAEASWKLIQYLNTPEVFAPPYYTSQLPARKSLLKTVRFQPEEEGFARQLADHTRSWGAYSEGPAPMGQLWNATTRAFGSALSDQMPVDQAAGDLHRDVERLVSAKK
ncbi:MAG: extracellular solute-binding protein [Pseudomonadota bacterium]|nr:extracellular solute-binding protein [Pseudomonadota bacterium]